MLSVALCSAALALCSAALRDDEASAMGCASRAAAAAAGDWNLSWRSALSSSS
jgi:hypothetical protein